jgi:hypothetical protein
MKKITVVLVTILSVLTIWSPCWACIGARAAGMSKAQVACVDDATAAYWNPAMIPYLQNGISFEINSEYSSNITEYVSLINKDFGFYYLYYTDGRSYLGLSKSIIANDAATYSLGIMLSHQEPNPDYFIDFLGSINYKINNLNLALLIISDNLRPSIAYSNNNFTICLELYDALNLYRLYEKKIGVEYKYSIISLRSGLSRQCGIDATDYSYGLGIGPDNFTIDFSIDNLEVMDLSCSIKF